MLEEHLNVTGISTPCQLRHITDPEFWQDFNLAENQDIQTAAVRKSPELKKIIQEKTAENPLQYSSFSDQTLEILNRFETGQLAAAETLKQYEQIIRELLAEEQAHQTTGLNKNAYSILKILEAFIPANSTDFTTKLAAAAQTIDALYSSNDFAPPSWHLKEQQRKELRQQVRALVFQLGLDNWKDIPNKVDEYALKHYQKN